MTGPCELVQRIRVIRWPGVEAVIGDCAATSSRQRARGMSNRSTTLLRCHSQWLGLGGHWHTDYDALRLVHAVNTTRSCGPPGSIRTLPFIEESLIRRHGIPLRYAAGIVPAGLEKLYLIGLTLPADR